MAWAGPMLRCVPCGVTQAAHSGQRSRVFYAPELARHPYAPKMGTCSSPVALRHRLGQPHEQIQHCRSRRSAFTASSYYWAAASAAAVGRQDSVSKVWQPPDIPRWERTGHHIVLPMCRPIAAPSARRLRGVQRRYPLVSPDTSSFFRAACNPASPGACPHDLVSEAARLWLLSSGRCASSGLAASTVNSRFHHARSTRPSPFAGRKVSSYCQCRHVRNPANC